MKLALNLLLLTCFATGFAQNFTGKLVNQQNKPISDAYVYHFKSQQHAHSKVNGNFSLADVAVGDSIQITHIGFETLVFKISSLSNTKPFTLKRKAVSLNEVVLSPSVNALNVFSKVDLEINPVNSSQEILQQVPGLFIGQHAGGGKAEQIFLRGFDIDHGTDINITVDDIPVNMVSHAHGQGYSDLHFVIPETVSKVDFDKGTYYADKGNFTTAGFVNFNTKNRLDNSLIRLEVGDFDTQRLLGMFNIVNTANHSAYVASEYISTDGPFESPQNFSRVNLMGKYSGQVSDNTYLSVLASHFTSTWDASGQIPQRAVDSGLISRFGAIDDTEGGITNRTNLVIKLNEVINENSVLKNTVYYSNYNFELFSNFTFFLNDPVNGDQIKQTENRHLFGFKSVFDSSFKLGNKVIDYNAGISLRHDESNDNELSRTKNRIETLSTVQLGDVRETNLGGFADFSIDFGKWTINPSLRLDYFKFNYSDNLTAGSAFQTQSENEAILSPKLNVLFTPNNEFQFYLKTGKGFHSNDTRVVVAQEGTDILPAAYSADLGMFYKPFKSLLVNVALWNLYLEQEFVYVGDEGVVEPSGETNRQGIDLSLRYQPLDWLFVNLDGNYTHARAIDEPNGADYIPLAPDFTVVSGLHVKHPNGVYGGLEMRHIDDRPANEDNSIVAEGYTVFDTNIGYQWNNLNFGLEIQNLFDVDWNETQFATESRLQNEAVGVEEIHFTPGTSFFIKGHISYSF